MNQISPTVAVLNDYSLPKALALAHDGAYPAHHTWGVSLLGAAGFQIGPMPFPEGRVSWIGSTKLRTLSRSFLAQTALLFRQGSFDVVYTACQSESWLLARLRRFGIFRKPIVMLVHHPLVGRLRGGANFVAGHDRLLFLSHKVLLASQSQFPDLAPRMHLLPWGVDHSFYATNQSPSTRFGSDFFISAGKANRDHTSLAAASVDLPQKVVIVCSEGSKPRGNVPLNVEVVCDATGHALAYRDLLSVYEAALAVIVPLENVDALAGLTSLLDAMACGKPVIMSRNPYIDIDIEKLGFGIWVDAGDVAGLHEAMKSLSKNKPLVNAMGERAREYAAGELAYALFSTRLATHLQAAST